MPVNCQRASGGKKLRYVARMCDRGVAHEPPRNYRDWKSSDYTFYDAAAKVLHDEGVLCEPDSREPWCTTRACR